MSKKTKPELFIIESLTLEDEDAGRQEGEILSRMLRLAGKDGTRYYYIRTKRELEEMIDLFEDSDYRYLHISCHANTRGMATTFDHISFVELGKMLAPCLEGRRVFVSACQMAHENLAKQLLPETGCYSLIGPQNAINFDDAAAFWVAFYQLMFKEPSMKREELQRRVRELSAIFEEPINYFASSQSRAKGYVRVRNKRLTRH
ncbi:CHAT domain-containing protein [Brucella intermedia]|uniref:CHAT domain-containing protein n=1 Tax=Brucella intermedia TaxID=94625 RepID=UPI00224ABFE9|nr:CHAT domain-containing protein [Brucella intermedia]